MKPDRHRIIPCTLDWLVLLLAFASLPSYAEPLPGNSIESLLEIARTQNPEIAASRYEADAATERIYPAGALPDPMLRTELRNFTNQGTDAGPNLLPARVGSTKYTLIQPVPFWGKRDLRRDVAVAEADLARGRATASWSDLASRLKTAYAQYYVLSHVEKLTRDLLDLAGSLEKISQARYASGLVPQQDVIRAQVELTGMHSELVILGNERHHVQVKINTLLKRPAMAPLAEPERLRIIPSPEQFDHTALEERMRVRNPQLFSEEARVTAAARNRDLVYKNRYPDFSLGLSPIQTGSRINEWELMIELNIPLRQESRRSQEREAQAMLAAAESRKEATQNQLAADLSENVSTLETVRYNENLTRTNLVPQSELNFKAALAGYETGKVDFATLLDAQRQIRITKLNLLKFQGEMQFRLAEIERLLGEDL